MRSLLDDYRALREDAAVIDLAPWRVLRLRGSETREFLQGMATQDLAHTGESHADRTLFLSEKGRPVSLAWVAIEASGAAAWVIADEGSGTALRPHFERFRIMEDVEFEGPEGMPRVVGAAGPNRSELLEALDARFPESRAIEAEPVSFLLVPEGSPELPDFAPPEAFEAWRLATGLPRGGVDFDLDRIATELDLPEAISFTKGCYVGQEVVARTSNRGQVRRRRVGFRFPWPGGAPARMSPLTSEGATAGFLTSAAPEPMEPHDPAAPPAGRGLGMGYVSTELLERGAELTLQGGPTGSSRIPVRLSAWPL